MLRTERGKAIDLKEGIKHVFKPHRIVTVLLHLDFGRTMNNFNKVYPQRDKPVTRQVCRCKPSGEIVENAPTNIEHKVSPFNRFNDARWGDSTTVKAKKLGVSFWQGLSVHGCCSEGTVQFFDQLLNLVSQIVPPHFVRYQHHQCFCRSNPLQDGVHSRTKFFQTASGFEGGGDGYFWIQHMHHGNILRYVYVCRLHLFERMRNQAFHLCHSVVWGEGGPPTSACGRERNEVPNLPISQGVMQVSLCSC
mmetsp:Transcript_1566/g.9644  ORF Transcript_1566/g.9644 Transcript_1566/m.9644 type:complete len:249 (+) Transcript_1566:3490-4236(+)